MLTSAKQTTHYPQLFRFVFPDESAQQKAHDSAFSESLGMAAAAVAARLAGATWRTCTGARERRASSTRWRVSAEGTERDAVPKSATRNPVVCILWDLDNINPGIDPERARITARRLRDAASRLGGGSVGGESGDDKEQKTDNRQAGPADVVAFLGFGNQETLDRTSSNALRSEGVDVHCSASTPDAADMQLGAHVIGFAHAWAVKNNGSTHDVPPPEPFVTERALTAARKAAEDEEESRERDVEEENVESLVSPGPSTSTDAGDAAEQSLVRNALDSSIAASKHFSEKTFADEDLTNKTAPPAILLIVTSDNDLVPAIEYARCGCHCHVAVCGDFVPKSKLEGGKAQLNKRMRTHTRRHFSGNADTSGSKDVGVTNRYWSELQRCAMQRPVGRLKLCEKSDAALVWDSTRRFEVGDENLENAESQHGRPKNVLGGVVGVWRKNGGTSVGRWPSPKAIFL